MNLLKYLKLTSLAPPGPPILFFEHDVRYCMEIWIDRGLDYWHTIEKEWMSDIHKDCFVRSRSYTIGKRE